VDEKVIKSTLEVAKEFFTMPAEYRQGLYSDDPTLAVRLSTSFNVEKEKVYNWRDFLRHHCYPLEDYINDWPSEPSNYRYILKTHFNYS
jgi:salicylic acid 3-hydroxylase